LRRKQTIKYDSLDMDVITSIGDTAASLGLVSTLVFSIAVNLVLKNEESGKDGQMMCMCLAISTSTYTTTYSLLEYYYTTTIKGLNQYIINEVRAGSKADTPKEEQVALSASGSPVQDHGDLMKVCIDGFASFNDQRQYAKDAAWGAICSILFSAISKFHFQGESSNQMSVPVCWKSAVFFCGVLCFLLVIYVLGFKSGDVMMYIAVSAAGLAASSSVAHFYSPEYHMPTHVCSLILSGGVLAVIATVRSYRAHFMPLIQEHAKVY